jgi:hypothetical protein
MRALSGYLAGFLWALAGCASSANKNTVIFYLDPPPDGDDGCIGVVGFDVTISSGNQTSVSGPLLNASPVLEPTLCQLSRPFSLPNLDLEAPASVTVTGHDGAGTVRVEARGQVDNLHGSGTHLQLMASMTPPPPVLVVSKGPLLGGAPISEVTHLIITTMRQPVTLVDITPGEYFSVEPGAYGVAANLSPIGANDGLELVANVTLNGGTPLRSRITAHWSASGRYYTTQ